MAITVYSDDDDLIAIRPNILQLGISGWDDKHEEAFGIINRTIIARWYKEVVAEHGVDWRVTEFDPDKVETGFLTRLSSYKTLELAYTFLMKDSMEPDPFERQSDYFRKRYKEELDSVLSLGINYDWDDDDVISSSEKYQPRIRRLLRA